MDSSFSFWTVVIIVIVAYIIGAKFPVGAQKLGIA